MKQNGFFSSHLIILTQMLKMFTDVVFCQKHKIPQKEFRTDSNLELPGESPDATALLILGKQ